MQAFPSSRAVPFGGPRAVPSGQPRALCRPSRPLGTGGAPSVHICGSMSALLPSAPPTKLAPAASSGLARAFSAVSGFGPTASLYDGFPSPFARLAPPAMPQQRPGAAPATVLALLRRKGNPLALPANPRKALDARAQPSPLETARLASASAADLAPPPASNVFRARVPPARGRLSLSADPELERIRSSARATFRRPGLAQLRAARGCASAAVVGERVMRSAPVDRHQLIWGIALSAADEFAAGALTDAAYEQLSGRNSFALQEQLERVQSVMFQEQGYHRGVLIDGDGGRLAAPPLSPSERRGRTPPALFTLGSRGGEPGVGEPSRVATHSAAAGAGYEVSPVRQLSLSTARLSHSRWNPHESADDEPAARLAQMRSVTFAHADLVQEAATQADSAGKQRVAEGAAEFAESSNSLT
ncbi:hypothetical protein T492DRAFT_1148875 [Pavlovales sp. CCMP2436]|nr:hypothetical protein T492DRAFT_1148875 [Pavlovales sp. CCMP2436]